MDNQNIQDFILAASSTELEQIVELIRLRRKILSTTSLTSFAVGDKVQFDAKSRGIVTGTLVKKNRNTVIVNCDKTCISYRVSPGLLKSVQKS